jgi:hypothetical protein
MSERELDSEFIEVDNDITAPGASKQTNRNVTDRLIKKPSHEDFVAAWSEAVLGKGLTFERVLTPLYKEIGSCFMGDGWQSIINRPILNLLLGERQAVRKSMICMMKSSMTNPKEPSHSEI